MIDSFAQKFKKLKTNLNIKRTLGLVWSVAPKSTVISISMVIVESALFFCSLYFLKILIDKLAKVDVQNGKDIFIYVLLAAISAVLYAVSKSISAYTTEIQAAKVSEFIDDKIHESAIKLDLSFYESPAYFDILKRAKEAGPERPNAVVTNLIETLKNLMMLLALGSVILSIDWFLFPLLVLFVLPTMLVRIKFAEKLHSWRMKQTSLERKSVYLSGLITSDTSAKDVRSLRIGDYLRKLYLNIRLMLLSEKLTISKKSMLNEIVTTILATTGFFACVGYIANGVITGKTSVGDITLFLVVFPQSFNHLQALAACISKLYQNNIFVTSIFDLFDLKPVITDKANTIAIPKEATNILVNNVSFTYPHGKKPVLKNININIPSGKIIAIVGLNGAGKTTLIKLLSRLYDPTQGSIDINNINIKNFSLNDYHKEVSVVYQDFGRYNFSAEDNIKFGNIDAEHDKIKIIEAAKNSGADLYINNFPDGYQTMMGRLFDDGHEVSIGQWQKLAIARALYSPARLLILDEATSALDAFSEREFFQSLRTRIGDRAALIISHRVSAVEHADYIYVISEGEIKQEGSHNKLINEEGDYALLFKKDIDTKNQKKN
ncbi:MULTISPECIES: ABC transporter ATP-binding protein [unclassified Pedobacter]|uniref:ABC transporter ATP-binding protein n=1 Tax=unclassified Pedobacter TaxID=2628915 RepID=UPI001E294A8E|nr:MULTISPECIES: ABC transporter ATP-binding protein [unclassified Pedobacter]